MEDVERLREVLASTKQLAASQAQRLREQDLVLRGIRALSADDEPAILIGRMFDLLGEALAFDQGFVLGPGEAGFICIASTETDALGSIWPPGEFFTRVAAGRGALTFDNARVPEWAACPNCAPGGGSGIYLPIVAPKGQGLLILCAREQGVYSSRDLTLVSGLGLLVSQTLAAGQTRRLAEAAQRLEIEREAAVRANEVKSNFFANMSHEIRTPLNGVLTVAELLARTRLDDNQREMTDLIVESSQMLARLLNDVLDFSKIESGHLDLERAPFALPDAVNGVCELFAAKAGEKGLGFELHIGPRAEGWFEGDRHRVRQVLANLLSNAVKFTDSGGVEVRVDVLDDGPEPTVVVRVRDSGCGFSQATADRLFDRFEQADGSITRKFGGSGLGLAISRSLARLMAGDIVCSSAPGQGAVFEFRFRARRSTRVFDEPADLCPESTPQPTGARILVAEDNPNNRRIVAMVLELAAADVVFAENGAEAVDRFQQERFDVILMDLQMPVLDGLSATRQIRALEADRGLTPTPIVALSANAMAHHIEEALDAGADAHVAKPISPSALLTLLAEIDAHGRDGLIGEQIAAA